MSQQTLRTNTEENKAFIESKGVHSSCIAIVDDKIMPFDPRMSSDGKISERAIASESLFDLSKDKEAYALEEQGQLTPQIREELEQAGMSDNFVDLLKESARQSTAVDGAFQQPWKSVGTKHTNYGLGAAGQLYETAYETARRINYLRFEARRSYFTPAFQARNMYNIESVSNFTWDGFTQPKLMEGQPHIGDDVKPLPARPTFEQFDLQLYADSFRFELSIREKTDSFMDVQESIQRQVPAIMEKMVNDRLIKPINDRALDDTALTAWNARGTNLSHFSNDAGKAIEDVENALEQFEGPIHMIAPRDAIRLYDTNIQGVLAVPPTSNQPAAKRSGQLDRNSEIKYFIDNHMTDNHIFIAKINHWAKFLEGPKLEFAYRDEMTAGNMEGRVKFHYNNFTTMIKASSQKKTGYRA